MFCKDRCFSPPFYEEISFLRGNRRLFFLFCTHIMFFSAVFLLKRQYVLYIIALSAGGSTVGFSFIDKVEDFRCITR